MESDVARRVVEAAAEVAHLPASQVSPEHHFQHDLKYDSLSAVEFAMALEDEFEIQVPDDVIPTLLTVQQAIDYVRRERSKSPTP